MQGVSCELFVRVAGAERRDGGVEGGGVAHAGVLVAGGERAGDAAHRAAVRDGGAADRLRLALFLGPHLAGGVHLRPGDVAVHVDAAGHDDEAAGVERSRRADASDRSAARRSCRPAIQRSRDLAVDAVGRIVNVAAGDEEVVGHAGGFRVRGSGFRRAGDRRQETGDRRQETGDRRQETGDRRQETGDRRQETESSWLRGRMRQGGCGWMGRALGGKIRWMMSLAIWCE